MGLEEKLKQVHPELAKRVRIIIERVAMQGFDITVGSALRTMRQQTALYNQGRTTKGAVVTNAPAGFSPHNYGCAVDFQLTKPVKEGDIMTHFPDRSNVWSIIGKEAEKVGLEWGGTWKRFKDRPHVEVPLLKYGRPLLKLVAGENLSAVWKEADKVFANNRIQISTLPEAKDPESVINPDFSEDWKYTVKAGDTLTAIAAKYLGNAMRYPEIQVMNNMTGTGLTIGTVLLMPKR